MKKHELKKLIENKLKQNIGKDIEFVSSEILKELLENQIITIDLTCNFCDNPCNNKWCESSYVKTK